MTVDQNQGEFNMDKIKELVEHFNTAERLRIAMMLNNAAEYVRSVVVMEVVAARIKDLDTEDFKDQRESTDRTRSNCHNIFIDSVNRVNEICDKHGVSRIYTGGSDRRDYGNFAMELVSGIFARRN
jgi:hypothetical protein